MRVNGVVPTSGYHTRKAAPSPCSSVFPDALPSRPPRCHPNRSGANFGERPLACGDGDVNLL